MAVGTGTGTGYPLVDDACDRVPARGDIVIHLVHMQLHVSGAPVRPMRVCKRTRQLFAMFAPHSQTWLYQCDMHISCHRMVVREEARRTQPHSQSEYSKGGCPVAALRLAMASAMRWNPATLSMFVRQ